MIIVELTLSTLPCLFLGRNRSLRESNFDEVSPRNRVRTVQRLDWWIGFFL